MIKCICCDLDDTLYPESSYYGACYEAIARVVSTEDYLEVKSYILGLRRTIGDTGIFQRVIEHYNLDPQMLDDFIDIYRTFQADIALFPDVAEYLQKRPNHVQHGILTNGGKMTQENKIRLLGIRKDFDFIAITGEVLPRYQWKPHKRSFELILDRTGCRPQECLYIGNSLEHDVIGALTVGMKAVQIDRTSTRGLKRVDGKSYWVITSFRQLWEILGYCEA